jgi:hypothetical protein
MHTMLEIKDTVFVDSDIHEDHPGYPLGSFRVSIGGMGKRVYFPWTIPIGEMRPIGKRRIRARSYKVEAEVIKNLVPGQLVDLVVNVWDANPKDARHDVFSLARIKVLGEV